MLPERACGAVPPPLTPFSTFRLPFFLLRLCRLYAVFTAQYLPVARREPPATFVRTFVVPHSAARGAWTHLARLFCAPRALNKRRLALNSYSTAKHRRFASTTPASFSLTAPHHATASGYARAVHLPLPPVTQPVFLRYTDSIYRAGLQHHYLPVSSSPLFPAVSAMRMCRGRVTTVLTRAMTLADVLPCRAAWTRQRM